MPYVKKGAEVVNPETGYVHLAPFDLPMSDVRYLGDDEGGPYQFRLKRRIFEVDQSDMELTDEERWEVIAGMYDPPGSEGDEEAMP